MEARRERGTRPAAWLRALDLARPVLLLVAFAAVHHWLGPWGSAPFALATVLAASVLVHDLIHDALAFRGRTNEVLLALYALFLLKSGHALRRLHREHHKHCLADGDLEGGVVYIPTWRLLVTGPWLALEARLHSWRSERRARGWQVVETTLNVLLSVALVGAFVVTGNDAPLVYLGAVVAVTVTVPILGAKIPHLLPERWPRLVRILRPFAGRLTPAASSLLFHELHHRRPRLPAALLPENADLLSTTAPSPCVVTYAARIDR